MNTWSRAWKDLPTISSFDLLIFGCCFLFWSWLTILLLFRCEWINFLFWKREREKRFIWKEFNVFTLFSLFIPLHLWIPSPLPSVIQSSSLSLPLSSRTTLLTHESVVSNQRQETRKHFSLSQPADVSHLSLSATNKERKRMTGEREREKEDESNWREWNKKQWS